MSIDAIKMPDTPVDTGPILKSELSLGANTTADQSDTSVSRELSLGDISAAVQAINAHLLAQQTEPKMSVDYLSGLDVLAFKSQSTGDVLFQVPSVDAVRLARLIGEGASLSSLGLMDATA